MTRLRRPRRPPTSYRKWYSPLRRGFHDDALPSQQYQVAFPILNNLVFLNPDHPTARILAMHRHRTHYLTIYDRSIIASCSFIIISIPFHSVHLFFYSTSSSQSCVPSCLITPISSPEPFRCFPHLQPPATTAQSPLLCLITSDIPFSYPQ